MKEEQRPALIEHLRKISDPRREMEEFGEAKEEWLRTFLELPRGVDATEEYRHGGKPQRSDRSVSHYRKKIFHQQPCGRCQEALRCVRGHWAIENSLH
jgi:hypothetical protein